jgi:TRAP-type C4-dicarboxylate transport system permease small subunit
MAFFVITQGVLLGMAAVMAIPSLLVFLSLVLPPRANRWANVILGIVYTVIMILAIQGGWHFYASFGLIEITLTALIVWYAWTWPKQLTR